MPVPNPNDPNAPHTLPDSAIRGRTPPPPPAGSESTGAHHPAGLTSTPQPPPSTQPESTQPAGVTPLTTHRETTTSGLPEVPGYELLGEIARGGMGVVYTARDVLLARDVAVKTLLPQLAGHRSMAAQFEREAQITARLPHPGVPPVHALGTLPDGRPFLAMKLIRGRTLAAILGNRWQKPPSDSTAEMDLTTPDAPGLLQVFEQVCQAVAFAHSQGIIHRDLKPLNIMVGAFGEVQVMDWGLAKHVDSGQWTGDSEDEDDDWFSPPAVHSPLSTAPGQAKGTPAYMPPEQAKGEWDRVNARADVFALGGILCVILTGQPPYSGTNALDVLKKAARGELDEAFDRLDKCGADLDLVKLAKRCLSPVPAERPTDAASVAGLLEAYRLSVEERLRAAETQRAAAAAKAEEAAKRAEAEAEAKLAAEERAVEADRRVQAEAAKAREARKRRRTQVVLAGAVALLLFGAIGFAWWRERQREERLLQQAEREKEAAERNAEQIAYEKEREFSTRQKRERASELLNLTGDLRTRFRFREAAGTIEQATKIVMSGGVDDLKAAVVQARLDLVTARELHSIRGRRSIPVVDRSGIPRFDHSSSVQRYQRALLAYGLDLTVGGIEDLAARIRVSDLRNELIAALDDWSLHELDSVLSDRLLTLLKLVDPSQWTDRLRSPTTRWDAAELQRMADGIDPSAPPLGSVLLAGLLLRVDRDPSPPLLAVLSQRPDDVRVLFTLAIMQREKDPGQSVGYLRVVRGLLPDDAIVALALGSLLHDIKRDEEALGCLKEALRLDPFLASAHLEFGRVQNAKGDRDGAQRSFREAIRLDPDDADAHYQLGNLLADCENLAGAIASYQQAIRVNPNFVYAHDYLGFAYTQQRRIDEAIVAHRTAIRIDPKYALGWYHLGIALVGKNEFDEAIAAHRESLRLQPADPHVWVSLGLILNEVGRFQEAAEAFRRTRQLEPKEERLRMEAEAGLRNCDALLSVERSLPPYLAGTIIPDNPREYLTLAQFCARYRRYADAVQLYRRAFEANPNLVDDDRPTHRHRAAVAAIGSAYGRNPGDPAAKDRVALRKAALAWFREDLAFWEKRPQLFREKTHAEMTRWFTIPELATVQNPILLALLPSEEASEWQLLWSNAHALRNRTATAAKRP